MAFEYKSEILNIQGEMKGLVTSVFCSLAGMSFIDSARQEQNR